MISERVDHPYAPSTLSIPDYTPPIYTPFRLVGTFFCVLFSIFGVGVILALSRLRRNQIPVWKYLWMLNCAFIHTFFEGYFVLYHKTIASHNTLFGELWKEYALSDSRYLVADPAVLWIEAITSILWGPMCFLVIYLMLRNNTLHHLFGIIISVGQIYGTILYFATTMWIGSPHCLPHPYYFYFYFVFMNIFWVLMPLCVIFHSFSELSHLLSLLKVSNKKLK